MNKSLLLRKKVAAHFGICVLALALVFTFVIGSVKADVTVIDENDIWDAIVTGSDTSPNVSNENILALREYWQVETIYDKRGFMKFDLSSVPTGGDSITVLDVKLGLYYLDAWGGSNADTLCIGYTADAFTTSFTWPTYDGINPWTDGNGAGVEPSDGKYPNLLASIKCDPAGGSGYKIINTVALSHYISNQVKASQNAYLWLAINNESGKYQRFFATDIGSNMPYMEITTGEDTAAPTPNPSVWKTEPHTGSASWIAMEAKPAGDPSGVEYYFNEISGNPGGTDSNWQENRIYIDTGLNPDVQYIYQVKARDKSLNLNETAYSDTRAATTKEGPVYIPTMPQPAIIMQGYRDSLREPFRKIIPPFNVIEGATTDADFVKELRAGGGVFACRRGGDDIGWFNSPQTPVEMALCLAEPFEDELDGALPGGFDAISVIEIAGSMGGHADGEEYAEKTAEVLRILNELYPEKLLFVWTTYRAGHTWVGKTYITELTAVRDYADMLVYEAYRYESNPRLDLFRIYADNIEWQAPGIRAKTIYDLYIPQNTFFIADDSTDKGFWGFLDEQMHIIKNDPVMVTMPGISFWPYYRAEFMTPEFCAKLSNHYYVENNTTYFGDGNYNQLIANPQFETDTSGWTLLPVPAGIIERINYSAEGVTPTYSRDRTSSSHGEYGLKMVRGSAYNQASYQIDVDTGMTYTVSAFVIADTGSGNSAQLTVTTSADSYIASKNITDVGSSDWSRIIFNFDLREGEDTIKIILNDEFTAPGRTLYWDFIEFEEAYPTKESPVITSFHGEVPDSTNISFNWWGNYSNNYIVRYSDAFTPDISQWLIADPPGAAGYVGEDYPIEFTETLSPSILRRFYCVEQKRDN